MHITFLNHESLAEKRYLPQNMPHIANVFFFQTEITQKRAEA